MSGFTYRGYTGAVEIDTEAERLHGRVLDLDAVLTFVGDTVPEAEQAFRDTVDDYLAWCAERGKKPEKPYSGTLYIRTSPDVHREAAIAAAREGKSLNAWLAEVVAQAAHHAVQTSERTRMDR